MTGVHFLHNVSLFANLAQSELEALARLLIARKYRENEHIFSQNSLGGSLYLIKSGTVGIVVIDSDGEQQTLAEFGPGQAFGEFGLLDGLPRSAGAIALSRCELLILSRPDFFMFLEQRPSVAVNLLVMLSRRLRFAMQRTEDEAEPLSPLEQLADLLADFGVRYGYAGDDGIELPIRLTQGELAGMLGCPKTRIVEALRTLQDKRLITMQGLQMIIHDLEALRVVGAEPAAD